MTKVYKTKGVVYRVERLNYEEDRFEVLEEEWTVLRKDVDRGPEKWGCEGKAQWSKAVKAHYKALHPKYAHDTLVMELLRYLYTDELVFSED